MVTLQCLTSVNIDHFVSEVFNLYSLKVAEHELRGGVRGWDWGGLITYLSPILLESSPFSLLVQIREILLRIASKEIIWWWWVQFHTQAYYLSRWLMGGRRSLCSILSAPLARWEFPSVHFFGDESANVTWMYENDIGKWKQMQREVINFMRV